MPQYQPIEELILNIQTVIFPALWEIGLIYEKNLNDLTKAKEAYSQLVEKYPKSKEADDALKPN